MKTLKGYIAGVIALTACPCHLPITFPIFLSLTAGTAFGTWLRGQYGLLLGILGAIFIIGLGLAFWWLANDKKEIACEP